MSYPNEKEATYLLMQHKADYGDITVDQVTIFDNDVTDLCLAYRIGRAKPNRLHPPT